MINATQKDIMAILPVLATSQRKITNPHLVQFYIRAGSLKGLPWIAIGINSHEYAFGLIAPKKKG